MKILLVTSFWGQHDGGLALSCLNFTEMLLGHGHHVYIVPCPEMDIGKSKTIELFQQPQRDFFEIFHDDTVLIPGGYRTDLPYHLRFAEFSRRIEEHFKSDPPDICIAFGAAFNGLFASHLSSMLHIPLLVCLRGSEINLAFSNLSVRYANQECLKRASGVVGLSEELIRSAKEIEPFSPAFFSVIPNAVRFSNITLIKSRPKDDNNNNVVLGIASRYLNEKKGIGKCIKVLGVLARKYTFYNWHLELVGEIDGDLVENYRELASREMVQDLITFQGLLHREEWMAKAQNWDASLQMSFFEGFSNSNVESWAAGIPVLFSNTGFFAEQLRNTVPQLILPNGSEEEIADKIWNVIHNGNITELSNYAIRIVQPLLDEKMVYLQWENIFQQITHSVQRKPQLQKQDWALAVLLHDISEIEYSSVSIPIDQFRLFIKTVKNKGYSLCSAEQYAKDTNKERKIICTFDDGYEGVYKYAFPIMRAEGFTATVFVPTSHIGKENNWNPKDTVIRQHMNECQLKELNRYGWEIGSHGTDHRSLLRLNEDEVVETMEKSKCILSSLFGSVASFAYPYGHSNEFIRFQAGRYYERAFVTGDGGNHLILDRDRLRRYSVNDILAILGE